MDSMVHGKLREHLCIFIPIVAILGHKLELESFLQDSWNHISKNRSTDYTITFMTSNGNCGTFISDEWAHHFMSSAPITLNTACTYHLAHKNEANVLSTRPEISILPPKSVNLSQSTVGPSRNSFGIVRVS